MQGLSVEELICDDLEAYVSQEPKPSWSVRPIGLAKGKLSIPDSFFESLPEELLDVLKVLATLEEIEDEFPDIDENLLPLDDINL